MLYELPPQVNIALRRLNDAGFSAFVVGGAVRNMIMGKPVNDWDITTSALPEETSRVFSENRVIETGLKHGTVTVRINGESLEITTFRIEKGYSDRRRPDEVLFTDDLEADLSRRDFTCNAIAYNPDCGLVDCFGGREDIENRVIRCVGDPDKRFNEDALRILRALRFSSVLGFGIDKATSESIIENYRLLSYVSRERIFAELSKLLCGTDVGRVLREYPEVIFYVLPCLKDMMGCEQNHERHIYDVWGHTVKAVESVPAVPELRFAMLFHDCGKPSVKTTDENGIDHFHGHGDVSCEMANEALLSLKTSNEFRRHVCDLVKYHDFLPHKISPKTYSRYIGQLGMNTVRELFVVREADVRAQNPVFLAGSLNENEIGLSVLDELEKSRACFRITDLKIDGRDLIALGFEASPKLGYVLKTLFEEVTDNKIKNEKNALLERAKELL